MGRTLWNVVRLVMAIAVVLAIIVQSSAAALAQEGDWDPSRYYAYFSIQAYLIGAVVLFWAFRRRNAPPSRLLDLFRGASTAYLMVTFFVVLLFLSELTASLELPGVDLLLHKIFPVVVVIDWILFPPATRLRYTDALRWLIYPVAWLAFTLVRGAADGWYPYSFLDLASGGYGTVALGAAGLLVAFLVASAVTIWLGNWRAAMTPPTSGLEEPRAAAPPEPPGWERPIP